MRVRDLCHTATMSRSPRRRRRIWGECGTCHQVRCVCLVRDGTTGLRGARFLDVGFVYAPYVPLTVTGPRSEET